MDVNFSLAYPSRTRYRLEKSQGKEAMHILFTAHDLREGADKENPTFEDLFLHLSYSLREKSDSVMYMRPSDSRILVLKSRHGNSPDELILDMVTKFTDESILRTIVDKSTCKIPGTKPLPPENRKWYKFEEGKQHTIRFLNDGCTPEDPCPAAEVAAQFNVLKQRTEPPPFTNISLEYGLKNPHLEEGSVFEEWKPRCDCYAKHDGGFHAGWCSTVTGKLPEGMCPHGTTEGICLKCEEEDAEWVVP